MTRYLFAAATVCLLAVQFGCAVAKIDVDVYKGPLANDPDVQVEQMAALAIAAKPMLGMLENRVRKDRKVNDSCKELKRLAQWKPHEFTNDQRAVLFLCEVDSLYEDAPGAMINPREIELKKRITRLEQMLKEFEEKKCESIFEKLAPKAFKKQTATSIEAGADLFDAIDRIPTVAKSLFWPGGNQSHAFKDWLGKHYPKLTPAKLTTAKARGKNLTTVIVAEAMQDNELMTRFAKERKLSGEPKKKLLECASKYGAIYILARETAALMLDVLLDKAINAHRIDFDTPADRDDAIRGLAKAISKLVLYHHLDRAATDFDISVYPAVANVVETIAKSNSNWQVKADELCLLLIDDPHRAGTILREFNALYIQSSTANTPSRFERARRRYGIAWPNSGAESYGDTMIAGNRAVAKAGRGLSFDRGRPEHGIYKLVDNYINARKHRSSNEQHYKESLDELVVGLIHFAQKVVYFADNEVLLTKPYGALSSAEREPKNHTVVLQSVGNAILSQANDLIRRTKHGDRLRERFGAEVAAIRASLSLSSAEVLNLIRDTTQAETNRAGLAKNNADKALTTAKTTLTQAMADLDGALEKAGYVASAAVIAEPGNVAQIKKRADDSLGHARPLASLYAVLVQSPADADAKTRKAYQDLAEEALTNAKKNAANRTEHQIAAIIADLMQQKIKAASADDKKTPPESVYRQALTPLMQWKAPATASILTKDYKDGLAKVRADTDAAWTAHKARIRTAHIAAGAANSKLGPAVKSGADDLTAAKNSSEGAANTFTKLNKAQDHINEASKTALGQLSGLAPPESARSTHTRVLREIEKRGKAAGVDKNDIDLAKERVNAINPPSSPAAYNLPHRGSSQPTSKDAIDQLIALLRYEYLIAVKAGGKDSDAANRLEEAIHAALLQRADMTYIRSAMSYLRSVHTATALQDNTLAWENELGVQAVRAGIPFGPHSDSVRKTWVQSQIDKQSWQNINRIRVAGGGNVNYVMAKDPVGNWYVKAYSTNKDDIVNSAKNLALFGIGSRLGADLINTGDNGSGTRTIATTLTRQFGQFSNNFNETNKSNLDKLVSAAKEAGKTTAAALPAKPDEAGEDFETKIKNAIAGKVAVVDEATANAEKDTKEFDVKAIRNSKKPIYELGAQGLVILHALEKFRTDVDDAIINAINDVDKAAEATKHTKNEEYRTAARAAVKKHLLALTSRALDRQKQAIETYTTALGVVGSTED